MKKQANLFISAFLLGVIIIFACARDSEKNNAGSADEKGTPAGDSKAYNLEDWPKGPREAVEKMTEKYGEPQEKTASMMVWNNNGPWKRTIIYKEEVEHHFPKKHTDYVEQFINYKVPTNKFSGLADYDGSVIVERTKGEISARCDREEMNFLALNLSHDIITGKKTVQEAREFYAKTAMDFMAGKSSNYVEGLIFDVAKGNTGDPDKPMMMGKEMKGEEKNMK